jgi:hypothetical protein
MPTDYLASFPFLPPGRLSNNLRFAKRVPQEQIGIQVLAAERWIRRTPEFTSEKGGDAYSRLFLKRLALFYASAFGVSDLVMLFDPRLNPRRAFWMRRQGREYVYGYDHAEALALKEKIRREAGVSLTLGREGSNLGVLAFGRLDEPFTVEESVYLSFLAHALDKASVVQLQRSLAPAVAALDARARYLASDTLSGRAVSYLTADIRKTLKAEAVLYYSWREGACAPEYGTVSGQRKVIFGGPVRTVAPHLAALVSSGKAYITGTAQTLVELGNLLPNRRELATYDHYSFVLMPVASLGDVIGLYVVILPKSSPVTEEVPRLGIQECTAHLRDHHRYLFQRRFNALIVQPVFHGRETRIDVGTCAILMPFTQPWSQRIWSGVLKPALVDLGFKALRADDLYGHDVMEDIWSLILRSEVVVADTTGRNPNVFYELGLAHTLGKQVILLTQNLDDIPFDLNRYRHVLYQDNLDGYEALRKGVFGGLTEAISRRA